MKSKVESMGIKSEMLDSLVHDAVSDMGSNANNSGMSDQMTFL